MEDLQVQMGAILNDPEMMKTIMSMASSLGKGQDASREPPKKAPEGSSILPDIDLGTLQKLSGLAHQSGIDSNQKNLLKALSPYLNQDRIQKLERAMRAARLAQLASSLFGGNLLSPPGR